MTAPQLMWKENKNGLAALAVFLTTRQQMCGDVAADVDE